MNTNITKKQKLRRNGFAADFNDKESDFILADLEVMRDEEELSPVPLNHFLDDEEIIDRLLINSDVEANDELNEDDREPDTLVIDDIDLSDDFSGFDQFIVEPIEPAEHNRHTQTDETSVPDIHFMADFDPITDEKDAIDRLLVDAGFDANHELEQGDGKPRALVVGDINPADELADSNEFVVDPVEQAEQKRHIETDEIPVSDIHFMADFDPMPDAEEAIDRLLVDAGINVDEELKEDNGTQNSLVIDDIGRVNECGIHFEEQSAMVADAGISDSEENELGLDKDATDVVWGIEENPETTLQDQVISETTYPEEALKSLNNDVGITTLSSVRYEQESIKKQINDYANKDKKAAIITYSSLGFGIVALLSIVVMGVIVSNLQSKVSKLTELVSILEEDMSSIAGKNSDLEINNSDSSVGQLNQKVNGLPEQFEGQTPSSSDISENAKTVDVTKQAIVNKSNIKQQTKTPVLDKKKLSETTDKKVSVEKKRNDIQPAKGWSVNLTAYEDLSYAKSKAENFMQKGIPVKVIAVDMNNKKWYRLKVGGFKNEEEATAYAAKIKKSLNLKTVFVGKN